MFTGLVQAMGTLRDRERRGPGYRLRVGTSLGPLAIGESIAVSGACLTAVAFDATGFDADVSLETVEKTTLGRLAPGAAVNLERSLALGDKLGGHLVSGHVDGVARIESVAQVGEAWTVVVRPPSELGRYIAPKGSVALDGVSLTVNRVEGPLFEVMLIPHTREVTTLGGARAGVELNLEIDLLARYVVRFLEARDAGPGDDREAGLRGALSRAGVLRDGDA